MLLLALDTATTTCSAALLRDDRVLAEVHLHLPRVHAQHLTPLVDDLLTRTEQAPADVDAVAVSMGPGSYTGLRIGVSTAKGWALAHDAALVGVPTLEALAAQVRPWGRPGDVVCALLDARRDDVYAAAYRLPPSPEETLDLHAGPEALDVADVPTTLRLPADAGTVWLLGDGASKADPALRAHRTGPLRVVSTEHACPSAVWVGRCARERLSRNETDDVALFEPLYLKAFHGTPSATRLV